MASDQKLQFDRSLVGVEAESGRFPITVEEILRFCELVNETNPVFTDEAEARRRGYRGLVSPPTMVNLFIGRLDKPDAKLSFVGNRLHAGQALEVVAPVCAGDELIAYTQLKDVYAKTGRTGTMAFIVWETRFVNQQGETAVRVRETFMSRP